MGPLPKEDSGASSLNWIPSSPHSASSLQAVRDRWIRTQGRPHITSTLTAVLSTAPQGRWPAFKAGTADPSRYSNHDGMIVLWRVRVLCAPGLITLSRGVYGVRISLRDSGACLGQKSPALTACTAVTQQPCVRGGKSDRRGGWNQRPKEACGRNEVDSSDHDSLLQDPLWLPRFPRSLHR